jgi:Protein of unknown function (DUF3293)
MADDKIQGVPDGLQEEPIANTTGISGVPEGVTEEPLHMGGAGGSFEPESTASKVWEKSNEALIPAGRAEKEGKAYAEAPTTLAESEHPAWTGLKKFGAGMYSDTAATARQMATSPLGIAMLGTGELAETVPGAIGKVAQAAQKVAGAGFGAQGAEQAYQGGSEMLKKGVNAENLSKTSGGVGQALLGGAGALHGTEVGEQPATKALAAPVRAASKLGKPLSHIIPSVGGIVAASEMGIPHPFIVGGTVGRFILPPEALERMFAAGRTLGLNPEEANIEHLTDRYEKAKHEAKAPQKAYEAHEAGRQQGMPAPEDVIKAHEKAQTTLRESEEHLKAAQKDYADKLASKGVPAPADQPIGLIAEQQAAQDARTTPTPTKEENDAKLARLMEQAAPTEKPALVAENVKTPGQVQPETFPQTPTDAPRVDETTRMRPLAGDQGNIVGRKPFQLTEGTPEAAAAAPKQPLGEILPPEKPKTGRLGSLKVSEGGKVVDTEPELQQKIEEGLQGTAKPVALKPLTPAEKAPLGKIETNDKGQTLGFDHKPAEDIGSKVREGEKEASRTTERRVNTRNAEDDANFSKARKELGEDATFEQIDARAKELKNPKAEYTPEHETKVEQVITQHSDQDLLRLAKKHGIDTDKYDFAARDEHRHRVERDQLVKDLLAKLPEDDKTNISRLSDEFNKKDTTLWTEAERNSLSKAQRSRAIMQEHESGPKTVAGGAPEGAEVAVKEGGGTYKGIQEGVPEAGLKPLVLFDHPETGSTLALSEDEVTPEAVKAKLEEHKAAWDKYKAPVDVSKAADDYNKDNGLHPVQPEKIKGTDKRASDIADAFDKMKHDPNDPAVKASYDALKKDINKQWDYATNKLGIKIEPTDAAPYVFTKGDKPAEKQLFDDVNNNKHLGVFRGGNPLQEGHPLAEVDPKTGETYNTMFRAIHDLFGHVAQGHDFSEAGEESAWNAHMQMMDPVARPAMTTETRGQTSWFFNNEDVRFGEKATGQFADQKAGILPDFAMERDAAKPKEVFDHIKGDKKPFAILTAENPGNERLTDAENTQRNHDLLQDLKDKGYNPKFVGGVNKDVEGKTEHAFFVPDITPEDAAELGKKHGQESILTQDGLHHLDSGKTDPSDNKGVITGDKAKEQPYYFVVDGEPFAVPFKEETAKPYKDMTPEEQEEFAKNNPVSGGSQSAGAAKAKEVDLGETAEKHLTPEEREGVTKSPAQTEKFLQRMSEIPEVHEYTDIANAGAGARKWYQRSSKAFDAMTEEAPEYFKEEGDKEKFINLLAASSPRQTVAMNLRETLRTWKDYVDKGRPTGDALKALLDDNLTPAVSKTPNALKALNGQEMWPDITKNKNFKVPSFSKNLNGWLGAVTNDGWMSLFAGLGPREISSAHSYHPLSVATRAAAEELGWEPAEAQAAIWSFTQALTERGEELPEEVRKHSEDFVDLMKNDPQVRDLLADLGVTHANLDAKLEAIGEKPEVSSRTTSTTSRSTERLKERIEDARGKGTIPPPKSAQGELGFREASAGESRSKLKDEDTSFDPSRFRTQTEESPKSVTKNASGESDMSQENINRVASQKNKGIKTYRVDSRSGNRVPILSADAADITAKPYEHIIQVDKDGNETILDSGRGARPLGMIKSKK